MNGVNSGWKVPVELRDKTGQSQMGELNRLEAYLANSSVKSLRLHEHHNDHVAHDNEQ